MNYKSIEQYIDPIMIPIIPAMLILGAILKRTKRVKDEYIPSILALVSIVLAFILTGNTVKAVVQGLLCTGAAVGGHQWYKQTFIKGDNDETI